MKGEAILDHLGMAATQIDQFTQALFGQIESVAVVCAILILVVGIPLYCLRLTLERTLIRVIRSAPALLSDTLTAFPGMSLIPVAPLKLARCPH